MVGGTGLYVDAVVYGFTFRRKSDPSLRAMLQQLSVQELQDRLLARGYVLPENKANPRHLIRLLESGVSPAQPKSLRRRTLIIGLTVAREILKERIELRVEAMIEAGLLDEVRSLCQKYGDEAEALRTPGYKPLVAYIRGDLTLSEAKRQFVRNDIQLAKRQRTWFRRNKSIHWLAAEDRIDKCVDLITTFLNN